MLGIICGSGLGSLAQLVEDPVVLPYDSIPQFPVSTAPGHSGQLVTGHLSGVPVVLMRGRLHVYEGYPLWMCTMPVRSSVLYSTLPGGIPIRHTSQVVVH